MDDWNHDIDLIGASGGGNDGFLANVNLDLDGSSSAAAAAVDNGQFGQNAMLGVPNCGNECYWRQRCEQTMAECNQRMVTMNNTVAEKEHENHRLSSRLQQAEKSLRIYQQKLVDNFNTMDPIKQELDGTKNQLLVEVRERNQFQCEAESYKAAVVQLQAFVGRHEETTATLRQQISQLQIKSAEKTAEAKRFQEKATTYEAKAHKLKEENKALKEENATLKRKLENAQSGMPMRLRGGRRPKLYSDGHSSRPPENGTMSTDDDNNDTVPSAADLHAELQRGETTPASSPERRRRRFSHSTSSKTAEIIPTIGSKSAEIASTLSQSALNARSKALAVLERKERQEAEGTYTGGTKNLFASAGRRPIRAPTNVPRADLDVHVKKVGRDKPTPTIVEEQTPPSNNEESADEITPEEMLLRVSCLVKDVLLPPLSPVPDLPIESPAATVQVNESLVQCNEEALADEKENSNASNEGAAAIEASADSAARGDGAIEENKDLETSDNGAAEIEANVDSATKDLVVSDNGAAEIEASSDSATKDDEAVAVEENKDLVVNDNGAAEIEGSGDLVVSDNGAAANQGSGDLVISDDGATSADEDGNLVICDDESAARLENLVISEEGPKEDNGNSIIGEEPAAANEEIGDLLISESATAANQENAKPEEENIRSPILRPPIEVSKRRGIDFVAASAVPLKRKKLDDDGKSSKDESPAKKRKGRTSIKEITPSPSVQTKRVGQKPSIGVTTTICDKGSKFFKDNRSYAAILDSMLSGVGTSHVSAIEKWLKKTKCPAETVAYCIIDAIKRHNALPWIATQFKTIGQTDASLRLAIIGQAKTPKVGVQSLPSNDKKLADFVDALLSDDAWTGGGELKDLEEILLAKIQLQLASAANQEMSAVQREALCRWAFYLCQKRPIRRKLEIAKDILLIIIRRDDRNDTPQQRQQFFQGVLHVFLSLATIWPTAFKIIVVDARSCLERILQTVFRFILWHSTSKTKAERMLEQCLGRLCRIEAIAPRHQEPTFDFLIREQLQYLSCVTKEFCVADTGIRPSPEFTSRFNKLFLLIPYCDDQSIKTLVEQPLISVVEWHDIGDDEAVARGGLKKLISDIILVAKMAAFFVPDITRHFDGILRSLRSIIFDTAIGEGGDRPFKTTDEDRCSLIYASIDLLTNLSTSTKRAAKAQNLMKEMMGVLEKVKMVGDEKVKMFYKRRYMAYCNVYKLAP